ncbi:hypothetical protein QYE76_001041 [Lolium multiflorum]|uniref:Retrotransposon gag domain-containing protein n=1 Tax=Lolium multiflorum TaxID=4521 RepID=A0AAD8RMZ0_LOLMU|nr:hypothetical protein QYE76_001041 [Lolium multiflorum]
MAEDLEWERSKISNQDMNLLKKLGFTKGVALPQGGELSIASNGAHGGMANSILHVSIFITLCECFLESNLIGLCGSASSRRNDSHGVAYNIGSVVICVRSDVEYFDVKFPDSVQGMKRRQASHEEERGAGREDGRETGQEAGHEDISWTREGGAGGMRERREEVPRQSAPVGPSPTPDRPVHRPENKSAADIITWREYEALRNEMRREFRAQDEVLNGKIDEISQKLDATHVTVTTMQDQMTDVQRNLADLRLAVENLTAQQQQEDDEDPELQDDAHNARDAPRGNRPRGWAPLGRNGRGQDEEDGLGKPKFSIPKFEGGADVEEYLTWELKIEKLWSLHPHYTEDRKIKLASSEFDGYALRWWNAFVRNREEDGDQPIRTWRAMKEAMTSRFVPTNYLRNIYDKLTLLRQGVKTVDEYYMEMEMLMQRGRVRESLEMTMQRFLNGQRSSYRRWAFHTPRGTIFGTGAFDTLRTLLYSA